MDRILVLDPGDSTGWVMRDNDGQIIGGTIGSDHVEVAKLISHLNPDLLIYETFQLYPNKAQKMCWNSFYPCEVIGVIKYIATSMKIPLLGLQPSVKKYAGTLDFDTIVIIDGLKPTEHTKDAYRLFYYWYRNNERGPK